MSAKTTGGKYTRRAMAAYPDYVDRAARCDVPTCHDKVGGSRTVTWFALDGKPFSVLIRLCATHTDTDIAQLAELLPGLPPITGAYINMSAE